MKTHVIDFSTSGLAKHINRPVVNLDTRSVRRILLLVLAAGIPAVLASVVTIWAISAGALAYVSAAFWVTGFIFLALVIDADEEHSGILAASGLSLMVLAWMSSYVAPEFGVLAGFLVSAWVSVPVVRRLGLLNAGSS